MFLWAQKFYPMNIDSVSTMTIDWKNENISERQYKELKGKQLSAGWDMSDFDLRRRQGCR